MVSSSVLFGAALLSLANAHGVILAAQGEAGSPPSVGFQVDSAIARNCTGISPCQQDTTIIRDAEITANIVNECGRTELTGNIDVGENTENALAAKQVTQVKAGTLMTVTIHQVNADGAGPYQCDLDQTSNAGIISQNLTVTNNVPGVNGLSQAKTEDFNITVAMPANLACTGASTGNVCTVRCRNNAVAGPFGGCFAVQQTDVTPTTNSANQITTAQTSKAISDQIAVNQNDLNDAVAANQAAGSGTQVGGEGSGAVKGLDAANALAGAASVVSSASPTQTLNLENVGTNAAAAVATSSSSAKVGNGNAKGAGKASASGATAATATAATGKKGKNNGNNAANANNKRESALKWAKRAFDGSM